MPKSDLPSRLPARRRAGVASFATRLIAWHRRHGRHDLPWQASKDPYRVWLSEIMLQQTQVATVLPYYARFLERFADVAALAAAPPGEVMAAWAGLGYYARARNLHACARRVVTDFGGRFPDSAAGLAQLPGIGESTAAAIAAFCHGERGAILDGNVKRVLARHWAIDGQAASAATGRALWERARAELPPARSIAAYTQAIMDLGATVCTRRRPDCASCPVRASCEALRQGRVGELPAARPPRMRPRRTERVLVALRAGRVLLQRRPPEGIWGGLLCLPRFDTLARLEACARGLGATAAPEALAPLRHELTHLSLSIEPYRVRIGPAPRGAKAAGALLDDGVWVALSRASAAGLPAPHRVLVESMR